MASSFTNSAQSFVKYVSLGQLPAGVGAFVPLGPLMRWSTLTCAMIDAFLFAPRGSKVSSSRTYVPALDTRSLPPV